MFLKLILSSCMVLPKCIDLERMYYVCISWPAAAVHRASALWDRWLLNELTAFRGFFVQNNSRGLFVLLVDLSKLRQRFSIGIKLQYFLQGNQGEQEMFIFPWFENSVTVTVTEGNANPWLEGVGPVWSGTARRGLRQLGQVRDPCVEGIVSWELTVG